MMTKAVLLFLLGLVCLIKGGDWFVDSACGIARRFRVPELIIGATVVSIGTTLPEVMVSTTSAISGHPEIAYGNAIGSVICNTALISALTIAIKPGKADRSSMKMPVLFFFIAAVIYCAVSYTTGYFSRPVGLVMLAVFIVYIVLSVRSIKMSGDAAAEQEEISPEKQSSLVKDLVFLVIGAALIAVGANLLVENGTIIAKALHVPESVIALTMVAIGTSLPELVTAITSLAKGHSLLSLGNIIGANLFNLVLVSGVAVTAKPFRIPESKMIAGMNSSLVLEIPLMIFVMAFLTFPALKAGKTMRFQGIVLLILYAAFLAVQFMI